MPNPWPPYPVIYEINTWAWLRSLSETAGRRVTLGSVPQGEIDRLARLGFDGIWLMGVWRRSPGGRAVSLGDANLRRLAANCLPDFSDADITGSPYSIAGYEADPALGGKEELAALRRRFGRSGLRLVLDFIPNHLGIGHPWQQDHPKRLVSETPTDRQQRADGFFRDANGSAGQVFAYGRALNYAVWRDTVQLDYRRAETRQAMHESLCQVAAGCDGVRCDMAMLVTREVFRRTWGGEFEPPDAEFWPGAIQDVKRRHPGFLTIAEVYGWGMNLEYELQQQGFDYTYDKTLYDRVLGTDVKALLDHVRGGGPAFQQHLVRFIENHDEERVMARVGQPHSQAAATVALTLPGMRLLHEGQIEGWRTRLPVELGRRPREPVNRELASFYQRLLGLLRAPVFHQGHWELVESRSDAGSVVAFLWTWHTEKRLVAANLSPGRTEGLLRCRWAEVAGKNWMFRNLLEPSDTRVWPGTVLSDTGWRGELPGFDCRVYAIEGAGGRSNGLK